MNPSLIELRRKPHTSVSAIKEYLLCPRRFFLHYTLKVTPAFRAVALVFGSAWHSVIGRWLVEDQVAHADLQDHLRDDLVARIRGEGNVLFDDADEDEGSLVDTAVGMLDVFLAKVPRPEQTLGVEIPFELELAHPHTGELLAVPLIGALDAVVLEGGTGAIWELKSAKRKWSPDQFESDLQATAYGMAARQEGYDGTELRFLITTKGKKPDVQRETVVRHGGDEDELVEIAFGVQKAVEAGVDLPNRGWQCSTCPYAGACRP